MLVNFVFHRFSRISGSGRMLQFPLLPNIPRVPSLPLVVKKHERETAADNIYIKYSLNSGEMAHKLYGGSGRWAC